jgi:hypothetical protein
MNDEIYAAQCCDCLGAYEAVGVGDDTDQPVIPLLNLIWHRDALRLARSLGMPTM